MTLTWKEQLQDKLIQKHGNKKGTALNNKYSQSFPSSYLDDYQVSMAISDIDNIEKLSAENPLEISFYFAPDNAENPLHLRLFQWQKPIPLSDILPMLENLNLRTDNERPHKVTLSNKQNIWISDFAVIYSKGSLEIDKINELFQEAFTKIYFGLSENDGFNKLVLGASLSWREIMVLRTYAKYLRQVGFRFSQAYIENTLVNNTAIASSLIKLFNAMHNPAKTAREKNLPAQIEKQILDTLETVTSLDEDKIIRRYLDLIKATLRTNFYQIGADGKPADYLSIKLNSRVIPDLPLPTPLYEIFVYSPRFEGVHLRNTKVARGGLRWSDRREDFRTEILGLMKAQVVKNSVIVPSGAKGGFVLKAIPPFASRETVQAEVIQCYKSFIRGLLDITDNIKDMKFIRPRDVVCYDDPDPYLVVAADKGTATFSDIANGISQEYDFWLNDAFASGGSTGYDHKKMGITARGAWESVKRHFRELEIDVDKTNITVAGIGDMSGDVFGNGMLYNKHIKLVAAFDHRHIFIDPDPDPEVSYYERVRIFNLPTSSWESYNSKLISKGGGVFKRTLKSIPLTPQMKHLLDVEDSALAPVDLIRAILKAPVDLLFNGGIGTYVKASSESQADVGDRSNDYCRVNGNELRCKVVGEGGNLGFTQLGRVEYALNNGLINTDFIDNSAGVDCSDHEVNLKILLNAEVQKRKLSQKKRNDLLASLTQEVADLVLYDNYSQALIMSISAFSAAKNMSLHTNYIKELESQGILNRRVEFLPDDKELVERKAAGIGLTRPELAVLLAYTKIHIKHEILQSKLPEDAFLGMNLETAFPSSIRKKYQSAMNDHRLKRDIIATQLSNQVVNEMGITFVYRLQMETGATVEEIIRAHAVASRIYGTHELQKTIGSFDFKIPMNDQYEMLYNIRNLINLSTRWFLHTNHIKEDLNQLIEHYSVRIRSLEELIPNLMAGYTKQYLESITEKFMKAGLPNEVARRIATYRAIYTSLNIIEVATKNKFDLIKTAKVYFASGERINLLWFRDQIANDSREGHWNTLARLTLRDELDISQRALTVAIMNKDKKELSAVKLIEKWVDDNKRAFERWDRLLSMLHSSTQVDYTMFFIAIRELLGLILASQ
ncbi:NAD-specific glutamate dehydrogenase [Aquicella siphonis]|uniref:NAD-specific glutamate dehydrogenase n=1 Tax=Aquicella siphonis TaxID=254247 RepID=A0A5E4PIU8_9COXI|nr:NAD-glutamate dehydrogenase [Aquicella siphonis]VVC76874.1 NAD-specific glutamate dehydrogenase [Aquicella siphonis]